MCSPGFHSVSPLRRLLQDSGLSSWPGIFLKRVIWGPGTKQSLTCRSLATLLSTSAQPSRVTLQPCLSLSQTSSHLLLCTRSHRACREKDSTSAWGRQELSGGRPDPRAQQISKVPACLPSTIQPYDHKAPSFSMGMAALVPGTSYL